MDKHTEGPWEIIGLNPNSYNRSNQTMPPGLIIDSYRPRIIAEGKALVVFNGYEVTTEELNANMRLMAAAPDLSKALTKLLKLHVTSGKDDFEARKVAFAALERAGMDTEW